MVVVMTCNRCGWAEELTEADEHDPLSEATFVSARHEGHCRGKVVIDIDFQKRIVEEGSPETDPQVRRTRYEGPNSIPWESWGETT